MFECMVIVESIYEGVVELYYKNLLGNMPPIMVTAEKIEERPPPHILTLK